MVGFQQHRGADVLGGEQHVASCPLSTLQGPDKTSMCSWISHPELYILSKEFTAHEFTLLDLAENVGYGDKKREF